MAYKLFVGIPTYGMPRCEFAIDSGWALMYDIGRRHPEIEQVWVQRDVRTYRQEARKAIVEQAIAAGATHLLMLDDDHVFGGPEFDKLWEAMTTRPDVKMIGGLYATRGMPCAPCIFKLTAQGTVPIWYYPEDEVLEVDVIGFGFVLFDLEVFSRINPPWFNLGIGFGEDAAFCARLLQMGYKIHVHTGAKIGHLLEQPHVITEADMIAHRERMVLDAGVGTSKLAEAGWIEPLGAEPAVAAMRTRTSPRSSRWWQLWNRGQGPTAPQDEDGSQRAHEEVPVESGGEDLRAVDSGAVGQ